MKDANILVDEFEKRMVSTEKRIDDIKWSIGIFAGIITLVVSGLSIVFAMNFNSEKEDLEKFKDDIKSELRVAEIPPQLELLGPDNESLADQEIPATIRTDENGNKYLEFTNSLKNVGKSLSGLLYEKIYFKDPIKLLYRSTDEPKFDYEYYFDPGNLTPNQIPGGNYSTSWQLQIWLEESAPPPSPGKYQALAKVYYGNGKVVEAHFWILVGAEH